MRGRRIVWMKRIINREERKGGNERRRGGDAREYLEKLGSEEMG